jgi:hypothetical protein
MIDVVVTVQCADNYCEYGSINPVLCNENAVSLNGSSSIDNCTCPSSFFGEGGDQPCSG